MAVSKWSLVKEVFVQSWNRATKTWGHSTVSFIVVPVVSWLAAWLGIWGVAKKIGIDVTDQSSILITAGIIFFLFIIFWLAYTPFKLLKESREKLEPKIVLSCNIEPHGDKTWFGEDDLKDSQVTIRLAVESGISVSNCFGFLTKITKDKKIIQMGIDKIGLPFNGKESNNALNHHIRVGVPENLNVIDITLGNEIALPSNYSGYIYAPAFAKMFEEEGEYGLHITVGGDNVPVSKVILYFDWTKNWRKKNLSCRVESVLA